MPPPAIRRPLTVSSWLLMSVLCLALSPLLLLIGAVASAITSRPQPLLLARLLVVYFARELGALLGLGALWLLSGFGTRLHSRSSQRLHYRLLRWFVHGLATRTLKLLTIDVVREDSTEASQALARDRPLLLFSRHAGPGDTMLMIDLLQSGHGRLPSVVFKETLAVDPSVDLLGRRLPHAVLDRAKPQECEARIEEVAEQLEPRGVLLLFPEGANFTPERRGRALTKLWRKGRRREAEEGSELEHVLPPHPTGALAALRGNPDADVIFSAHTGLGLAAFPRELWRHPPIGRTLKTRMWLVPAAERPRDSREQTEWIYGWWKRLDEWLEAEGEQAAQADVNGE